jgi:hypothetical protein
MPAATPPVAIGAPPVEVEDEGEDFLVPDAPDAPVVVAAAVLIVEAVLCAGTPVAGALEEAVPTAAEVCSAPMKLLIKLPSDEAQALTLLGRALYQAGMVPALISLSMEERNWDCRISLYHEAGMAVARTVRMECGMLGMATELMSGFVSEESEEPEEATAEATAESLTAASEAEARAAEDRRKVARSLNCIVAAVLKNV